MKKALLASLIAYLCLLVAAAVMMLTYVIAKNTNSTANVEGLFKAVTVVFIVFVVFFVAVITLLILYPKTLTKYYKANIEAFIEIHNTKYPGRNDRIIANYKDKNVYISFIMDDNEIDTYSFALKEKPLTKNEPKKISYNVISELTFEKEDQSVGA